MSSPAQPAREWWVARQQQLDTGQWDVLVQFRDGHTLRLILSPADRLDLVIAAAVDAHLRSDRRWSKRSERGG